MNTAEKSGANLEKALARKERDWQSMIRITHDFFHAWRKSVQDRQGEAAAKETELAFWENVGVGTGEREVDDAGRRARVRYGEWHGVAPLSDRDGAEVFLRRSQHERRRPGALAG